MKSAWEQVEFDGWIRSYRWNDLTFDRFLEDGQNRGQWEADLHIPEIGRTLTANGNSREEAIENLIEKIPEYKGRVKRESEESRERAEKTLKMLGWFDEFWHRRNLGSNAIHT